MVPDLPGEVLLEGLDAALDLLAVHLDAAAPRVDALREELRDAEPFAERVVEQDAPALFGEERA